MVKSIFSRFKFNSDRTNSLKVSVIFIAFYRGLNILISFLLIPATIHYVNPSQYGVWLTLSSMISWISLFDVGLGNGLRNKLSESLAINDNKNAKEYVSTTYFALGFLSVIIFIIGFAASWFVNWNSVLKISNDNENILFVVICLLLGFCLRFIAQTISTILFAFQKPQNSELIVLIGNILSLGLIVFFKQFFDAKLLFLVFALNYPPVFIMFIGSIYFFKQKKYRFVAPTFRDTKKAKVNSLLNLGVKFFILQISALVAYSITNFLILQLLDATDVTKYNIAYKYFSIITVLTSIVCTPLWSAFTEAYTKEDFSWMKSIVKKLVLIWLLMFLLSLVMLIVSNWFYFYWTGLDLKIPFSLSLLLSLFMLVSSWNGIFVAFINGIGKIKLQVYLSFLPIILMIPMSYVLVKYAGWGVSGIAFCMLFFNLISSSILTYQAYLVLNKKDKGIWSK